MIDLPEQNTMDRNHGGERDYFGDYLRTKPAATCRVAYINPKGLRKEGDSNQMMDMKELLNKYKIDVIGISEVNLDWRKLPYKDTMWGRTEQWFEKKRHISVAAIRRKGTYQAGGTVTMVMDKIAACKESVGQDGRRLGRWSWVRVKGVNNIHTRFVTIYFPNSPHKPNDHGTYNQQKTHLREKNISTCPKEQFWIDLKADILKWKQLGDQLVIGGDWNTHLKKVSEYLNPLGLKEVITGMHGLENAPNTYIRGSDPIDGVFVTASLQSTESGYLPFNKGYDTDHRIIWFDVPIVAAIGFEMKDLKSPKCRRLKTNDPQVWRQYNYLFKKYSKEHKIEEKSLDLLSRASFPMPDTLYHEFVKLDKMRTDGMLMAEKRCCKLRKGHHPWSPAFSRARKEVKLWAMLRQRTMGSTIGARTILRLLRKLSMVVDPGIPLGEIEQNLAKAKEEYAKVKKKSAKLRATYIEELARAHVDNDESKLALKIRALLHQEDQERRISRAIRFTTDKLMGGGTTRVVVPDANGDPTELTDKEPMERAFIAENIRKYHRTESYCPLLHGQLLEDIGLYGEGPRVDDILNGTYQCPDGTPEGTKLFLDSMKHPQLSDRTRSIATRSSYEEFKAAWKRKREASSSSGPLHYGHYRAGCRNDTIAKIHYNMAEIMLQTGCSTQRHREGTDVMILKAAGDYRIHRLRTICLFDAEEFNMNNDRTGKSGLAAAIDAGETADEQYSRPNRSAIDHVVNRRLTFDYFTYLRRTFGMCSCDLAGNYDRIVHAAASLALQRVGVPLSRIKGMFHTLQRMVKRVRTAFGDSDLTYSGEDVPYPYIRPPMGVNQGNCNGPPVWSVISSTIFSIMRKQGYGVDFITSISHEVYKLSGFAFVDDADIIQDGTDSFKVSDDLQKALNLYSDVMNATGQALEPKKSWWYLADFLWEKGEWSYTDGGSRSDLVAFDTDGKQISLKRLMFTEATKMLGVYMAPNGDQTAEMNYLVEKAETWAECIRVGHLGATEVRIALNSCIWKTILYPLPATTFSDDQITKIIWPILKVALPKIGINSTVPTSLRYGPKSLGGLGIINPVLDQGIRKIQYLLEHPWKSTPTGKIIEANIQALTVECGITGQIFDNSPRCLDWISVPDSWLQHTWRFMHKYDIHISNMTIPSLSLKRKHDVPIMECFAQSKYLTNLDLKKLNRCRLFLKCATLSDITDVTGRVLDHRIFGSQRKPPIPRTSSTITWPFQPMPPNCDWRLWETQVRKTFAPDRMILNKPLGDWLDSVDDSEATWTWFLSTTPSNKPTGLWQVHDNKWHLHRRIYERATRRAKYSLCGIPSDSAISNGQLLYRVSVCIKQDAYVVSKQSSYPVLHTMHLQSSPPPDDTILPSPMARDIFESAISSLPESSWLLRNFHYQGDFTKLLTDFISGTAPSARVMARIQHTIIVGPPRGLLKVQIVDIASKETAWYRGITHCKIHTAVNLLVSLGHVQND